MPSFEEPAGEGCQLVWAFASLSSTRFPCTPCQATLQEQPPPPSFPGAWEHSPAQDLDFRIFSRRMMMASKWETSPRMRKTFMVPGGLVWGEGSGVLSAGRESENREVFLPEPRSSKRFLPAQLSFSPNYGALSSGREKFRLPSPLAASAFPLPGSQAGCLPCLLFPPRWIFLYLLSTPGPSFPCSRLKVGVCCLESPRLSLLSSPEASAG